MYIQNNTLLNSIGQANLEQERRQFRRKEIVGRNSVFVLDPLQFVFTEFIQIPKSLLPIVYRNRTIKMRLSSYRSGVISWSEFPKEYLMELRKWIANYMSCPKELRDLRYPTANTNFSLMFE